jgi:anti-sigma factor RsiW
MNGPVTDSDLQAYVDGVLPDDARRAFEAHLAANPEDTDKVRALRDINAALRNAYGPVIDEEVPARLLLRRRPHWMRYGVAASFLIFGLLAGWFGRGWFHGLPITPVPTSAALARQAAVAHAVYAPEVRHPVEVGADQEDHLVKWLSKKLGTTLTCPKLGPLGYELVGGRLLSGPNGPVAHFMYQDARGARLTLYVSTQRGEPRETAFRFSQEDKVAVFYWIDGKYGYAISGEMGRDALLRVANVVYKQLNP